MDYIDFTSLNQRKEELKKSFQSKEPFRYLVFENFFKTDKADEILNNYPHIEEGVWDSKTYIDQKNKFQKTKFEKESVLQNAFDELNSPAFLKWLEDITEIEEPLIGDKDLFGGGLHQSIKGAFLNVHVDYNFHPKTKYHRRLNVLIYMNKDWKDEYEGNVEFWDFTDDKKDKLASVAPHFNRCVIFETNEISYHGHPKPLNAPEGINRKSMATYYYTKNRIDIDTAAEHNTLYKNTEGFDGQIKRFSSAFKALIERVFK